MRDRPPRATVSTGASALSSVRAWPSRMGLPETSSVPPSSPIRNSIVTDDVSGNPIREGQARTEDKADAPVETVARGGRSLIAVRCRQRRTAQGEGPGVLEEPEVDQVPLEQRAPDDVVLP